VTEYFPDKVAYLAAVRGIPIMPDYQLRKALIAARAIGPLPAHDDWQRWCSALETEAHRRGWKESDK
jgi:hypothetical protein